VVVGVRAVLFDAVRTLIHADPLAADVYADVGRRFGSALTSAEIAHRFKVAVAHEDEIDRERGFRTSEERELERWRRIVSDVLTGVSDRDACFRDLFHHFSQPAAWRLDDQAGAVIAELARRGLRLGIASNYDRRLRGVVAGLPALRPIQHIVISSEVGWRKPARQFYNSVCDALDSSPGHILHIGDDLANDYEAALAAGLRAVLFKPRGIDSSSMACISELSELPGLIRHGR